MPFPHKFYAHHIRVFALEGEKQKVQGVTVSRESRCDCDDENMLIEKRF